MLNELEKKLFSAAKFGDIQSLQSLSEEQVNFNCVDDEGNTPLYIAASEGKIEIVKFLIASITDALNKQLRNAFDLAFKNNHTLITSYIFTIILARTKVKHIPSEEIIVREKLGAGTTGVIYKALLNKTVPVAIKVAHNLVTSKSYSDTCKASLSKEILYLSCMSSPYIVQAYGSGLNNLGSYIVLKLYKDNLEKQLFNLEVKMSWACRMQIAVDIARGLEYIHACNVIHGDVKTINFLVDENKRAVVADLSSLIHIANCPNTNNIITVTGTYGAGTFVYQAPEILQEGHDTKSSDVYSFSIVMVELVNRSEAYSSDDIPTAKEFKSMTVNGRRPTIKCKDVTVNLINLFEQCWQHDSNKRPMMRNVVESLEKEHLALQNVPNSQSAVSALVPPVSDSPLTTLFVPSSIETKDDEYSRIRNQVANLNVEEKNDHERSDHPRDNKLGN